MMLTDASALVALADARDRHHAACLAVVHDLVPPLVTLLPALTEAMYLCGRRGGWRAQEELWSMMGRGSPVVGDLQPSDLARARQLMEQYRDLPMDFADSTLVAYAEREGLSEIFTLDRRDFSIYRLHGRQRFTVLP